MCEFCRKYNFELDTAKVDETGASISVSGGHWRFPKDLQFKFCPVCGRRLDPYFYDGMSNEQAERILISHLMYLAFTMPIEWIEKNGENSDFQKAYGMALDALRQGGG